MRFIGHIYFLLLPAIIGGVLNMAFVKLPVLKAWQAPIDGGKTLRDGKRIFGDNKTWKGFFGMIVLTAFSAWLCWHGTFQNSFLCGALLGLAYVLFELPNSFVKRRLSIQAGKNGGAIQTLVDQADSALGYAIFMLWILPLSLAEGLSIFAIGTLTHYIVNILLFLVKLRGQKG